MDYLIPVAMRPQNAKWNRPNGLCPNSVSPFPIHFVRPNMDSPRGESKFHFHRIFQNRFQYIHYSTWTIFMALIQQGINQIWEGDISLENKKCPLL